MDALLADLRYGLRALRRSPGLTAAAVLALGLGIGANSAIFSVLDAVVFNPWPFLDHPDRVVWLFEHQGKMDFDSDSVSAANLRDWKAHSSSLEYVAEMTFAGYNFKDQGEPDRIEGYAVSADYFAVLGVKPALGRTFSADEDRPGGPPVIVISDGLWKRRFGRDPGIIGRAVRLDGENVTILGVMPPGFQFPKAGDLWKPLARDAKQLADRSFRAGGAIARLRPGANLLQAQAELDTIAQRLAAEYPDTNRGWGVQAVVLYDVFVGRNRAPALALLVAVGFVLLIACANVANLLLARATERQRELAVRTALGASRARIVRQLLTESMLLGLAGGALGIVLALWGIDLLTGSVSARFAQQVPRILQVSVDRRVLLFTGILSLATGLIFGLLPALRASRPDLTQALKEGGPGTAGSLRHRRLASALVAGQIALAMILLIGAGLALETFLRLKQAPRGFAPDHLLTFRLPLSQARYRDDAARLALYRQVVRRLETLPGVSSVSAASELPATGQGVSAFSVVGRPPPSPEDLPMSAGSSVGPGYFRTAAIALRAGRDLDDRDCEPGAPPVVLVSESIARTVLAGLAPVGQRLRVESDTVEIVGVVADVEEWTMIERPNHHIYWPLAGSERHVAVLVRTAQDPLAIASAVRADIHALDPEQPVMQVLSMEQVLAEARSPQRLLTALLDIMAALALTLAAVGIYGTMWYAVSRRSHEIGIRMALGARQADVVRLVVGQGLRLAAVGVGVGLVLALALTRVMTGWLFGSHPADPATFAAVALVLAAVALVASYLPARKAARVDPMVTLRTE